MIKEYTDLAANERTYLAWIRTAIAIMAFGFLIEKFELYLSYLGTKNSYTEHFNAFESELIGLGLFLVGIAIILASTIRFFIQKNAIEAEEIVPYTAKKAGLLLSIIMICLGMFLVFYMWHLIF